MAVDKVTNISTGQGFTGSTPICRLGCDWLSLSSRNTISTLVNPAKNSAGIWGEHISYFLTTIGWILLLIFRNTEIFLCVLLYSSNDEYFVDAFAIFCGMGITNVMNFQAVSQANAKLKVDLWFLLWVIPMIAGIIVDDIFLSLGDNGRPFLPSTGNICCPNML